MNYKNPFEIREGFLFRRNKKMIDRYCKWKLKKKILFIQLMNTIL